MLRSQIKTSAKLSGITFASNIGVRLFSTIILTRLLSPEVYGIFAVVLVYLYILELLSDVGLRSLILTREGEVTDDFLSTCWTVSIFRGALIFLISCLIGGLIAILQSYQVFAAESPYAAEILPWAIAISGFAPLIAGLKTPMRFMWERDMRFERVAIVDITRNLASLIVVITLAFLLRSVWAFVIAQIIRSCLDVALNFLAFRGLRFSLQLDPSALKILIDRGKWILSQSALTAISGSFDRIFLGLVMNSATFGFYFIARQLIDLLPMFLVKMNSQMGMQVFTRLQEQEPKQFKDKYYRYRMFFDAIAGLCTGAILVLAPLIVAIIYDERYSGVAPIMQILALAVPLVGPRIWESVFNAQRNFKIGTMASAASVSTLLIGLIISVVMVGSVEIALFVVALHRLSGVAILLGYSRAHGWVSFRRECMVFAFIAIGAGIGWSILELWKYNVNTLILFK